MYEWISLSLPNQKEIIRKQLLAEYGVDPESDEARNGTIHEVAQGYLVKASLGVKVSTARGYIDMAWISSKKSVRIMLVFIAIILGHVLRSC